MPELPEVQTVVNELKKVLLKDQITCITPYWGKVLFNFKPNDLFINGRRTLIHDVTRRAKFIIIHFPSSILAIHLRMTGKLFFSDSDQIPNHTTAVLELKRGKKLIFQDTRKFGRIYLYPDLNSIHSKYGPEPLGKYFTIEWFLQGLKKRRKNIKALLLDQSFLAGLGNIYVDESLWASGIHPGSISNAVPTTKIYRLYQNIKKILEKAITAKGSTIINFSFLNGQSGRYGNQLQIFGRQNQKCFSCGNIIKKIKMAGRGTYICGRCQIRYIKRRNTSQK